MKKVWETITTMFLAAKYSFGFCWRNGRGETTGRLIVSSVVTLLTYLTVQVTGSAINAVQNSIQVFKGKGSHTLMDIADSGLMIPVLSLVGMSLIGVVLGRYGWYYRTKWNQVLRFANSRELNNHRATLDVACFRSQEFDDLAQRIQELPTSWQTRISFSEEMFSLFTTLISFVLFGSALLWHKPIYALVLLATAIPMAIVEFRLVAMWWGLFQRLTPQHKKRGVLERAYRNPNAFIQAQMFNQMPALRKEIDINVGGVLGEYDDIRRTSMRWEMCTRFLTIAGLYGVIIHAVWSTVVSTGEIGTLTVIMVVSRTFQGNLDGIVSLVAEQWNNAKGVILIERDFYGCKPLLRTEYPVVPKFDVVPEIKFDNVSFTYPGSKSPVLKGVSFAIKPGSKVAIVGKSGNGKSTLLALLMRHYDPTSGAITAGGINLRNIEPSVWNNVASALMQEISVLERRVGEEVASSRLDQPVDLVAVAASARFADFEEVVSSDPDGYGAQIGTEFGGREFSGGERQRLALARVHYRGTPILILDEPDAKLDPESAQKVIEQIFGLSGITVIMITHHVSRAERCDQIIVMGKGEIVEQGTHDGLMAQNGVYASMHTQDAERLGSESE